MSRFNPFDDIAVMAYIINSGSEKSTIRTLIDTNLVDEIEGNGFGVAFDEIEKGKVPSLFEDDAKKLEFYFFKNFIGAKFSIFKIHAFNKLSSFKDAPKLAESMSIESFIISK